MLIALVEKKPGPAVARHREFGRKSLPEYAVVCCSTEKGVLPGAQSVVPVRV